MNTFNCYINGNEIITNGICNENVVLMGKDAAPGHDAAHPTIYKVVGQAMLQKSLKSYPVSRNLGDAIRTFRKGDRVPDYITKDLSA